MFYENLDTWEVVFALIFGFVLGLMSAKVEEEEYNRNEYLWRGFSGSIGAFIAVIILKSTDELTAISGVLLIVILSIAFPYIIIWLKEKLRKVLGEKI